MTVSYQYQVASSTSGGFTRLLFMWRGSLYKLIYRELFLFVALFGVLSALYRHVFTPGQKKEFEQIVIYCDTFIKLIPLSFVLGFYVSYVAQRWWDQYKAIPWPDKVMHLVALYVTGNDEYGRMLRRALMRYLNLSLILVLRSISSAVKRRFPTLDHVVDSGFMTSLELELFQSVPSLEFNTYWIPCTWFVNLLKEARRSHRLPDPQGLKLIMEEFNDFRSKCGLLWSYDWVSIPLVYTQVVTLATYSFFAVALVGRQYIEGADKQFQFKIDIYLPIFTILQFFFFMGLLKVAEQLINPFGDDDEDFELNWLIDRHTKVSYLGVDTLMNRCPPLVKDIYFDAENLTLPYTEAAAAYKRKTYRGSVANMTVPEEKQTMFLPNILEEDENLRETPTPRTSSASLATHNDSPVDERRQISESPQTTPKLDQNYPETILQLDIQEPPSEVEPPEQRHAIADAVRRFSALARHTHPRIDQNRTPFFALKKTPKVILQPWPSATNLSKPARQFVDTPTVSDTGAIPWRGTTTSVGYPPPYESTTTPESTEPETPEGIVNSAYSQESSVGVQEAFCDCNSANDNDSSRSDVCQFECRHRSVCQHLEVRDTLELPSAVGPARPRISSAPKYLVRRHRSIGESCNKKGIRWKEIMQKQQTKLRRRTTDTVPSVDEGLPHARSWPNLSEDASTGAVAKDVPDIKIDSSEKVEDVTKL